MTGKKENKKYSSYSFDCRDEPAMHNMQNISKIKNMQAYYFGFCY